jgi:hypothetical protein
MIRTLCLALVLSSVGTHAATSALSFSAGFTSDMVLQRGKAAAVYGLVDSGNVKITVVDDKTGTSYTVQSEQAETGGGSSGFCAEKCVEAGHRSRGDASCCGNPSCEMGCIFASRLNEDAACKATCDAAKKAQCAFTFFDQTFGMCGGCPKGGGSCGPPMQECYEGCGYASAPKKAWKAYLKPASAGGSYTITASTGDASLVLERVTYGDVYFCSGRFPVYQVS